MSQELEYRLHNGEVQVLNVSGRWITSAHNDATIEDMEECEKLELAVLPVLRQKFYGEASQ